MTRSKLEAMHYRISSSVVLSPNVSHIPDGGDYEAQNYQLITNV
jgi:hypothetical protein